MRNRFLMTVALVALGMLGAGTAVAARGSDQSAAKVVRWISQETSFVFVHADGTRSEKFRPPKPGDQIFVTDDFFATEDGNTRGEKIGTGSSACVGGAQDNVHCTQSVFLGGDQLHMQTAFNFAELMKKEPVEADFAIVGGTGRFRDIAGDAHITDISPEDQQVVLTSWEVRSLHLTR